MTEPLIELGDTRDEPQPRRRPPPHRAPGGWVRLLSVLLACALLAGSAPPAVPATVAGPPVPPGGSLLVTDATLLVVDPATAPPTMSAYDVTAPDGPPRWRHRVAPAGGWVAEAAGDLLLIGERDALGRVLTTTARSARTGDARWRRADRVHASDGGAVGVTESRSVLDPGRRVEGAVRGVDLADGRNRWTMPIPSTAVVQLPPGTGRLLVVHDSGVVRLHDLRDGAPVAQGRLPPADYAPDNPQVIGGRLVLRHPTPGGPVVAGYDLPGLTRRWQAPVGAGEVTVSGCDGLVCVHDQQGRRALLPGTGAPAWTWPAGGMWRAVPPARPDHPGPALLLRPAADGDRRLVAVADRSGVRVGGVLPAGATGCRAVPAGLVCRAPGGRVALWSPTSWSAPTRR
ncbi:hypothetical protein ACFY3U_23980 [Micromonospora sp. NPDC000089]|uniref:hypothetical protein n=1 Tax=unclassified Micromonospora TaxID=2617518 RepID=UPI00367C5A7F